MQDEIKRLIRNMPRMKIARIKCNTHTRKSYTLLNTLMNTFTQSHNTHTNTNTNTHTHTHTNTRARAQCDSAQSNCSSYWEKLQTYQVYKDEMTI